MALITIFLTVVSLTTPTLEELSQRTEPWVREDVTVTSVSEFHTSDLLREDEPVLLLHHAFLDDENETLRTVVCTDTRVIVLEEGVVVREIELLSKPVVLKCSPSGRFISIHRERDTLAGVRAFRVDTETGEQVYFDPFPGMNPPVDTWAFPNDDGTIFSVTGGRTWVLDADLNPSDGPATGIGYTTPYAFSKNGDIIFIPANRSAYDRRGNLLWTLSEGCSSSRITNAAISDDGSLVGLAMRDGAFLVDGATGAVIRDYSMSPGGFLISPSSNWFIIDYWDDEGRLNLTLVETETGVTRTITRFPFQDQSDLNAAQSLQEVVYIPGAQSILENGMVLLWSERINSCFVLDEHLTPIYHTGNRVKSYPAELSASGSRLVHVVEPRDSFPSFMLVEMERGN